MNNEEPCRTLFSLFILHCSFLIVHFSLFLFCSRHQRSQLSRQKHRTCHADQIVLARFAPPVATLAPALLASVAVSRRSAGAAVPILPAAAVAGYSGSASSRVDRSTAPARAACRPGPCRGCRRTRAAGVLRAAGETRSNSVCTSASADATLWAQSRTTNGRRPSTSSRAGQRTAASPARTAGSSIGTPSSPSSSTAATATAALRAWCSPSRPRCKAGQSRCQVWTCTTAPRSRSGSIERRLVAIAKIDAELPQRRAALPARLDDDAARAVAAHAADRRPARLDDARLLARDRSPAVSPSSCV